MAGYALNSTKAMSSLQAVIVKQIHCLILRLQRFEDDKGAYDQKDAGGFIKLNALRLRIAANLKNRQ